MNFPYYCNTIYLIITYIHTHHSNDTYYSKYIFTDTLCLAYTLLYIHIHIHYAVIHTYVMLSIFPTPCTFIHYAKGTPYYMLHTLTDTLC